MSVGSDVVMPCVSWICASSIIAMSGMQAGHLVTLLEGVILVKEPDKADEIIRIVTKTRLLPKIYILVKSSFEL